MPRSSPNKRGGLQRRRNRSGNNRPTFRGMRSIVPSFNTRPSWTRKFRFNAVSTGTAAIYSNCLLSLIAIDSSTTNSLACTYIISSIRIKSIQVYGYKSDGTNGIVEISLAWAGQFGRDIELNAIGNGVNPAYITSSPPAETSARFWRVSNSNESERLLSIHVGDDATIVDLTVEFTLCDGPASYGTYSVNEAAANVFYCSLDSLNSAGSGVGTGILAPDGVGSINLATRVPVSPASAE